MKTIINYLLCLFCLQPHRELDGPADSEGRGYGVVHRTAETVSVLSAAGRKEGQKCPLLLTVLQI